MASRFITGPALLLALGLLLFAGPGVSANGADVDFTQDILPILSSKCFQCHGPDEEAREGDLRLDTREGATAEAGSEDGQIIVPQDPEASVAWRRMTSEEEYERMPPPDSGRQLSESELQIIKAWIEAGAAYETHWSYRPIRRPQVPKIDDPRVRNPIDAFVLASLRKDGLEPSPEADPTTLVRRLSFDLLGLPPSLKDVRDFTGASGDAAYESFVDGLLASPHYGERMAVFWLDLVRYADTVGYHGDQDVSVSPFRDYVIRAFNANMPFDQFSREQLAGDLLAAQSDDQNGDVIESVWLKVASGYNRLGMMSAEGGVQPKEYLAKYAAERVRNVSLVWMGATMGCAECHNHKYDPYTTEDFYSLARFFADIQEKGIYSGAHSSGDWGPHIAVPAKEQEARWKELRARVAAAETEKTELEKAAKELEEFEGSLTVCNVTVAVEPRVMRVLSRGNWMDDSGKIVTPAVPEFLGTIASDGVATRLDLANWLVSRENPLTARVLANRLWKQYFGQGLARSLDDLGSQGVPPSHARLLDWLAMELIDSGWDVKHLVRLMVTSSTYQQSSMCGEEDRAQDPYNARLARQGRYRLDAEMVRDNALAVSGLLVPKIGGPSVKPYQPAGYYAHLNFPPRKYEQSKGEELWRRSVYTHWQRQYLHPSLMAFDANSREECVVDRPRSNTPLAALVLLNDPIYVEAARAFSERILREGGATDESRLAYAFQRALSRAPSEEERKILLAFVEHNREKYHQDAKAVEALLAVGERPVPDDLDKVQLAAWTVLARVIFNMHELITRS